MLSRDREIWDLFTRKEEYNPIMCDQFDRFPYYASGYRNILDPLASRYLIDNGFQAEYPEGEPFAVCLTHDIDEVYKSNIAKGIASLISLKAGQVKDFLSYISEMKTRRIPYWNFGDIMAMEEHYGAKSSFYFLVLDRGDQDYSYDIEDLEREIGSISDEGWEVGLHGGHGAYANPEEIQEGKTNLERILNRKVIGYRSHFLQFKVPHTWEHLSRAGFKYDATFGYADCVGFRNGMSHPFKPFNLTTGEEVEILEIPLMIMDGTLYDYMKLDVGSAWDVTKQLIDAVERHHGVMTILWHNTSMIDEKLKFYKKFLEYCYEKNAWMTSGEEIWRWWDKYV